MTRITRLTIFTDCQYVDDGREAVWHVYFGSRDSWQSVCAIHGRSLTDLPRHKIAGCNGWHEPAKVVRS